MLSSGVETLSVHVNEESERNFSIVISDLSDTAWFIQKPHYISIYHFVVNPPHTKLYKIPPDSYYSFGLPDTFMGNICHQINQVSMYFQNIELVYIKNDVG